jgi:hypothetical protein
VGKTVVTLPCLARCRVKAAAALHIGTTIAYRNVRIKLRELGENQGGKVARFLPAFYNDIIPFLCIKMQLFVINVL